jgi:hypothetical protein
LKFVYKTELEWLMNREQAKEDGFFIRDGKKFVVLGLYSDEKMEGYDFYAVDTGFAITKWQRAQVAATVEEEIKFVDWKHGEQFFEWLSRHIDEQAQDRECMAIESGT